MLALFVGSGLACGTGLVAGVVGIFRKTRRKSAAITGVILNALFLMGYSFLIPMVMIATPNFFLGRAKAQISVTLNDTALIEQAASIWHESEEDLNLEAHISISFDELVRQGFISPKSVLARGQTSVPLPPQLTYGAVYRDIDPTQKLQVSPELRNLFTPTIGPEDPLWNR